MEDFNIKSFKALFNERKSKPVTLDGGFNAKKAEAPMVEQEPKVEQAECKPQRSVADKPNEAKADGLDKQAVIKRESYKKSVFKTKAQLAHFPIPYGVYIEDVYGSIHSVEKWDKENSDIVNSVLVYLHDEMLNDSFKFRMAINAEHKGVDNGRRYCEDFVFPDKETHGRMPNRGEMCLLILHEAQIKGALDACGGDMFHNTDNNAALVFDNVKGMYYSDVTSNKIGIGSKKGDDKYVFRPFADVELKTPTEKKKTDAVKKESNAEKKAAVAKNGVYIQDVKGKLWKTEDWDNSVKPNAIAVITSEHKFRIALTEKELPIEDEGGISLFDVVTFVTDSPKARTDYNGVYNTKQILKLQPSAKYAAGWCDAYAFPDGSNGYLPALGELNLAYQNKAAIDEALKKCGGDALDTFYFHWSSTFYGIYANVLYHWMLCWDKGHVDHYSSFTEYYTRPFASLEI